MYSQFITMNEMYRIDRWLNNQDDICGIASSQAVSWTYDQIKQHVWMAWFDNHWYCNCTLSVKHYLIISMKGIMNGRIDEWWVDICGQYGLIPKTSPMTFWTQNTISSTSQDAICSVRAFVRCLHSNTWTPKACITYFTITQAFYIWISSISTEMVCW